MGFATYVLTAADYHCHGCDYEGPANVHDLPEEECTPDTNCDVRCARCSSDNLEPLDDYRDRMKVKHG